MLHTEDKLEPLTRDIEARLKQTYGSLFGYLPGGVEARLTVSKRAGRLGTLDTIEDLRRHLIAENPLGLKTQQLLHFGQLLALGQRGPATLHATGALQAGSSFAELLGVAETALITAGMPAYHLGVSILADLTDTDHSTEIKEKPMPQTDAQLSLPDRWGLKAPFGAVHHIAIVTNNMKKTVGFYRDVLGSEVALSHRLNDENKTRHYFITLAPNIVFAVFEHEDAELPDYEPPIVPKTGRALDHIAFFVEDKTAFNGLYERLQGQVDNLSDIRSLGIVTAFFFSDPNGIVLEVMVENEGGMDLPKLEDPDPAY